MSSLMSAKKWIAERLSWAELQKHLIECRMGNKASAYEIIFVW